MPIDMGPGHYNEAPPGLLKTNAKQVEALREATCLIKEETKDLVEGCTFDDWGRTGNGQVLLYLKGRWSNPYFLCDTNLRKLTWAVKRAMKKVDDVSLDVHTYCAIDHPEQQYDRNPDGTRRPLGYDGSYTTVHICASR